MVHRRRRAGGNSRQRSKATERFLNGFYAEGFDGRWKGSAWTSYAWAGRTGMHWDALSGSSWIEWLMELVQKSRSSACTGVCMYPSILVHFSQEYLLLLLQSS